MDYGDTSAADDVNVKAYDFDGTADIVPDLAVLVAMPSNSNYHPKGRAPKSQGSIGRGAKAQPPAVVSGRVLHAGGVVHRPCENPTSAGGYSDPIYNRPAPDFTSSAIPCVSGVGQPTASPPIPGYSPGLAEPLGNESLMSSSVCHIDQMANPEVVAENGTIEIISRVGEIIGYVARFFDNHTADLGPGVTGKALAQHLKSLNGRIMPLYEACDIPTGPPIVCA